MIGGTRVKPLLKCVIDISDDYGDRGILLLAALATYLPDPFVQNRVEPAVERNECAML